MRILCIQSEKFSRKYVQKKLSLEYVCHGICSKATLSRFENNIGDIKLNKFLKLLKKMEISETEFFLTLMLIVKYLVVIF